MQSKRVVLQSRGRGRGRDRDRGRDVEARVFQLCNRVSDASALCNMSVHRSRCRLADVLLQSVFEVPQHTLPHKLCHNCSQDPVLTV